MFTSKKKSLCYLSINYILILLFDIIMIIFKIQIFNDEMKRLG